METVSQGEAENIRKTIQDLFRQTCILQVKCDPATLVQRDNQGIRCVCATESLSQTICLCWTANWCMIRRNTFSGSRGWRYDRAYEPYDNEAGHSVKNDLPWQNHGEGLHATTTNLAEIREYGKNTNLITRRLTGQEWNDALVLMKTHQMIELPGAVANLEDFTPIYIYSTVNVFCSAMDINELVREYQNEMTE